MPCLNEAHGLRQTCLSLGFGKDAGGDASDTLVIVDNGSTDSTLQVAETIRQDVGGDRVVIVSCSTRGFVPARVAGADKVIEVCTMRGISSSDAILLQVDADAQYSLEYTLAFREAAMVHGRNYLYESRSVMPDSIDAKLQKFLQYLDAFDADYFDLIKCESKASLAICDCIVDDKTVGIILADWMKTGGLQRDYVSGGEMIYCGTSRFWLRLAAHGFQRHLIDKATCAHSTRKISEGADIFCASAGWPHGTSWKRSWRQQFPSAPLVSNFFAEETSRIRAAALQARRAHLEAMFYHSPRVFSSLLRAGGNLNPAQVFYKAFSLANTPFDVDLSKTF